MSLIGKNIKKIRTVKKLSQAAFSELFKLSRTSVGAYEEERAEPKVDTIIQIANYFGISVDTLLTKDLTINELYHFDLFKEIDQAGKKQLTSTPKKTIKEGIAHIKNAKVIEYLTHFQNKDFMAVQPRLVMSAFHAPQHRAFEIIDPAMTSGNAGIQEGDTLIGEQTTYKKIKNHQSYILITEKQLLCRRASIKGKSIEWQADNNNFQTLKFDDSEIKECWLVVGRFTKQLEPASLMEQRLDKLEEEMEALRSLLKKKK